MGTAGTVAPRELSVILAAPEEVAYVARHLGNPKRQELLFLF